MGFTFSLLQWRFVAASRRRGIQCERGEKAVHGLLVRLDFPEMFFRFKS